MMYNLQYLLAEQLIQERQHEAELVARRQAEGPCGEHRVRHALASTLVRVGLRLDPAADEGLPAFDVTLAGEKGGC